MTDPRVTETAEWLAALSEEERVAAVKQINQLTVVKAPAAEVQKVPVTPLGEYLTWDIPVPPCVVEPNFWRGEITTLTSRGGKGKTTFSLNRFARWAAGRPMFDELPDLLAPPEPVRTLIIENEGSAGMFQQRFRDILGHNGLTDDEVKQVHENILIWGDGSYSGVKLDDPKMMDLLERACDKHAPDIVFFDPFRSIWKGDENSNTEMNTALDALKEVINAYECAAFVIHHERKGGVGESGEGMDAARGATALTDAAAVVERWQHVRGGDQSELSWTKNRYRQRAAPVRSVFSYDTWGYVYVSDHDLDRALIEAMQDTPTAWHTVKELSEELGEVQRKVRDRLNALAEEKPPRIKRGRAESIPGGGTTGQRYRLLSEDGEDEGLGF